MEIHRFLYHPHEIALLLPDLIGANLPQFTSLPLQGGGQEGDGGDSGSTLPHPHPYPPLEGERVLLRMISTNQDLLLPGIPVKLASLSMGKTMTWQ